MIPTLRTERLTLRAFEEPDVDAWAEVLADPEGRRYVGGPMTPVETWLRLAAYHGHWVLRGYGQWAVVENATGRVVGRAEWGRGTLGLTRIASVIHPENARSVAVAERLGMTFDRTAELGGSPMAVYAMSL